MLLLLLKVVRFVTACLERTMTPNMRLIVEPVMK